MLEGLTFPMFLAACVVPHATALYWLTNGAFGLGLQAALSRPKVAAALGLPMVAVHARGDKHAAGERRRRCGLGSCDLCEQSSQTLVGWHNCQEAHTNAMCALAHTQLHTRLCVHTHAFMHTRLCTHAHTIPHTHTHMRVHTHTRACAHSRHQPPQQRNPRSSGGKRRAPWRAPRTRSLSGDPLVTPWGLLVPRLGACALAFARACACL